MSVIVVGGGWAGLAAAVELAHHKIPVTVLEASRHPGGRARGVDWGDVRVDNGQHLMIGAYRETLRLLARIHAPHSPPLKREMLSLRMFGSHGVPPLPPGEGRGKGIVGAQFIAPNSGLDESSPYKTPLLSRREKGAATTRHDFSLIAPNLPAPLHLLFAIATAQGLSASEHFATLRLCLALAARRFRVEPDRSVAELLNASRQPARVIECLWEPLCLATLNTPPYRASAQVFCTVLRDAFAHRRADSDLLFAGADLGTLFAEPAARYIEQHGGRVVYGERVTALRIQNDQITGLETSRGLRDAAQVILAVPSYAAQSLLEPHACCTSIARALARFEYEPICTVYLRFTAPVTLGNTMVGMTGGYTQWLIDRASCGQPGVIAAVISARGAHMDLDGDQLATHVRDEIARAFPALPAPVEHFTIREKRATFACTVGINTSRPNHATPVRGLSLAGDYTATGYPATLEGAVRSGLAAARSVLCDSTSALTGTPQST